MGYPGKEFPPRHISQVEGMPNMPGSLFEGPHIRWYIVFLDQEGPHYITPSGARGPRHIMEVKGTPPYHGSWTKVRFSVKGSVPLAHHEPSRSVSSVKGDPLMRTLWSPHHISSLGKGTPKPRVNCRVPAVSVPQVKGSLGLRGCGGHSPHIWAPAPAQPQHITWRMVKFSRTLFIM